MIPLFHCGERLKSSETHRGLDGRGIHLTLSHNLQSAIENLRQSTRPAEKLQALGTITEEFYRMLGIVFFARYSAMQSEKIDPMEMDVRSLIENEFAHPDCESWINLGKYCAHHLQAVGDDVITEYSRLVDVELDEEVQEKTRLVLGLLGKWVPLSQPPEVTRVTVPVFLQTLIRILEYSRIKLFTSVAPKEFVETGFSEVVPRVLEFILSHIKFNIMVPISFGKKATRVEVLDGPDPTIRALPPLSEYMRYLYTCYLEFNDEEDPFRCKTDLLYYDRSSHCYYVYSRIQDGNPIYFRLDTRLRGDERKKRDTSLEDIFGTTSDASQESLYPSLARKFGPFAIDNGVVHNMGPRLSEYIRRPKAEEHLKSMIGQRRFYTTTLDGGGGFGKTELARSVIWDLVESPKDKLLQQLRFKFIVWTTGQKEYFRSGGIEAETESLGSVEDLLDSLLYVTNNLAVTRAPFEIKRKIVIDALNQAGSTLVVLDNLETVAERETIWTCLHELINEVDSELRVLTTSRIKRGSAEHVVTVGPMEYGEARELTMYWMNRLDLSRELVSDKTITSIIESTGSIPLLIRHFVHLVKDGRNPEEIVSMLPESSDSALEFMFGLQWNGLSDNARKLLAGIAYRRGVLGFSEAKNLCSFSDEVFSSSVDELDSRSFLVSTSLDTQMLETLPPITLFAKSKLQTNQEIEMEFIENESLLRTPVVSSRAAWSTTTDDTVAVNQILQRADLEARQGAIYVAYDRLKQATERFPKAPEVWRKIGEFEYRFLNDLKAGRESFRQATFMSPTDIASYEMWALVEFEQGLKQKSKTELKRSARHYEAALQLASTELEQKRLSSLIGLTNVKIADIVGASVVQAAPQKRKELEKERDFHYRRAIDLLQRSLGGTTSSSEARFIESRMLGLLSWSYLSIGTKSDEHRVVLDDCALVYIIRGLRIDFSNSQIRTTLRHSGFRRALKKHGKNIGKQEKRKRLLSILVRLNGTVQCDKRLASRALIGRK